MSSTSPFRSLVRGLAAGVIGSAAQDVFFALTSRAAPKLDEHAPEALVRPASALVPRDLPVDEAHAGHAVHYAFGAAWGALYGTAAATFPQLSGPAGGAAFGALVWVASHDLLLPASKLAERPRARPPRARAYSIAAHLVYGAAMGFAIEKLTPKQPAPELIVRASERAPEPVHMRPHAPDLFEAGAGI